MDTFPPNAKALAAWNPNKLNTDGSTGGWELINGNAGAILVSRVNPTAEQQQQVFPFSGTASAMGQTSNIAAYGFAFQIFKFTKSSTVDNPTVYLCLNGRGVATLSIAGLTTETITVNPLVDGTNQGAALGWRKQDGTFATALGNGSWTLMVN